LSTTDTDHNWSIDDSIALYALDRWGRDYFGCNERGELVVHMPTSAGPQTLSLVEVVRGLAERGLDMPLMLRLENLLDDRIRALNEAFRAAIADCGYDGEYRAVFPVKVNQQSHVISEIVRFGERFDHGLEAGSKGELLVAMASLRDSRRVIICNGYKDEEFIDLGLQARKLGQSCFFVVETLEEIHLIIRRSRRWGVQPLIGVRLKLTTPVDGHWSEDSGDKSLFGLTAGQLVEVVDTLRDAGLLDSLRLLHFHIGSQIPSISNIRDGIREACRYYTDLVREGAPLGYLDLGGGLAVDYDGTAGGSGHSCNYSLEEYCFDVVASVKAALEPEDVGLPTLLSESGRATVAPMSVLLFNILHVGNPHPGVIDPADLPDLKGPLEQLAANLEQVSDDTLQACFNDAVYFRSELRTAFSYGSVSLRERALGEKLYAVTLQRIAEHMRKQEAPLPAGLDAVPSLLAETYYGNFSVFQSLPDAWAIGQVFPVLPIHRLDEEPTRQAIIADLTCDCDGKLGRFVGADGECATLSLHPLRDGEDYILGVFMVGAYQETLGDLHNLFGDTNVASVRMNSEGRLEYVHELAGDSVSDVLSYVEYKPDRLFEQFRSAAEDAVRDGRLSVSERQEMLRLFNGTLGGYTYLERAEASA
jgi:arginine decarboxylase